MTHDSNQRTPAPGAAALELVDALDSRFRAQVRTALDVELDPEMGTTALAFVESARSGKAAAVEPGLAAP